MDIFTAYGTLDKALLEVVKSLNTLQPVKEDVKESYLRVEEVPFLLTDDIASTTQVVTAHNLFQYKNDFHSLKLRENVHSVLQDLLKIDKPVEDL